MILVMVVLWGATKWDEYWQTQDWKVSAATVTRFTQAVRAYTGRYYETLLNSATTTTPVIVTPAMLKNTGFLEPGFSETISSGQKLTAALLRNSTNTDQLQGVIVSQGGLALPYMAVRDISVSVSAGLGAYLWDSDTVLTGANASWTMPMTAFGIATTTGHVASMLTTDELNAARQDTDRLYRFSVTGKPDLNRMHTSIDMGANDLNNAGTVNAETGQFTDDVTAGGDIRTTAGSLVTRGNNGWTNETHQGGFYMSDDSTIRSLNDKGITTGGQVQAGTVGLSKIVVAGTVCPKNGDLARDALGATLSCQCTTSSCQSLVWKKQSSGMLETVSTFTIYPINSVNLGRFKLCLNSYRIDGEEHAETEVAPTDTPDSEGKMNWVGRNLNQMSSYFIRVVCFN